MLGYFLLNILTTISRNILWKKEKNVIRTSKAFTLLEVLIAIAILAVLAAITIPIYTQYKTKINNAIAVTDIINIQVAIQSYEQANDVLPGTIAEALMKIACKKE